MGTYFDPSNESFTHDANSPIYIDKTGLLELLNARIFTSDRCIALSHARRFGKSQAAGMIRAYYSMGADSRELFSRFEIAKAPEFEKHLNKYHVIHLDISSVCDSHTDDLLDNIMDRLLTDFQKEHADCCRSNDIERIISAIYEKTGIPFVIIIDEWDCVIRNLSSRPDIVHSYMQFLHKLFKSEESKSFLALAYITGILPIKKIEDESALNNFTEYTMLSSRAFTPYFGFTEDEVAALCERYGMDHNAVKEWYDGYVISGRHMFNPNSVSSALREGELAAYWKNTSAFDTINTLMSMDFDGLKADILTILGGGRASVDVNGFRNDLSMIADRDDALTALAHLGYLAYDAENKEMFLPNREVAEAYLQALKKSGRKGIADSLRHCDDLLKATLSMDAEKVAAYIDLAHEAYSSILTYNDENSLACAVRMAYFTASVYYKIDRELPAGKGYADFAFTPLRTAGEHPAIIIELKWDQSADTAVKQIKERRYAGALSSFGEVLLVGINYDKDIKKHSCMIEKFKA